MHMTLRLKPSFIENHNMFIPTYWPNHYHAQGNLQVELNNVMTVALDGVPMSWL